MALFLTFLIKNDIILLDKRCFNSVHLSQIHLIYFRAIAQGGTQIMKKVLKDSVFVGKDGRKYIVTFEKGSIFIGTKALFSQCAAQLICHDVMAPLKWKFNHQFKNMILDDQLCIGVGYKVPMFTNARKSISSLFT